MDFANGWVYFLGHMDCFFMNSGGFALSEPAEVFKSVTGSFPQTVFFSAGENSVLLFQSITGKALWSVQQDSSLLWKRIFSPDGSILVIWIFWASSEILRQLICKSRDAQLLCIQWVIRDNFLAVSLLSVSPGYLWTWSGAVAVLIMWGSWFMYQKCLNGFSYNCSLLEETRIRNDDLWNSAFPLNDFE